MGLLGLVLIVLVGLLVLRNAVFTYPIAEQLVVANGDSGNCSKGKCSVIVSTPAAGFQCETGGGDAINADLVWVRGPQRRGRLPSWPLLPRTNAENLRYGA